MSELSPLLAEFDALLADISLNIDAMIIGEVEGLIAGIISLPKPVPADEWLPLIWGRAAKPFPRSAKKSARLVELALARKTEVVGNFLARDLDYDPVFDCDFDGSLMWEVWIEGFQRAIELQPEAWAAWAASSNADLSEAALGMERLIAIADGKEPPKDIALELQEMAPNLVCYYAENIYRCQRGMTPVEFA
jgi:uncharacterized protein